MDDIPTLGDIARLAGFSKSTVSLALRNHPRIPSTTRKAIQAIAEKLDYHPDPALARIAANRWRRMSPWSTIAFITTNHPKGGILDDDGIRGARLRADTFGYRIEHFRFEDYGSSKRLGEVICSRGIKGIILGKLCRHDFSDSFPWHHFAAVACDTGFVRPPLQIVMPDHAHAVHRAWAEAAAKGYRRIGMVLFEEYTALDYFDKVSAYAFNARAVPEHDRLSVGHFDPGNDGALEAWIRKEKPDAILGFNGYIHHWLRKLGYSMPSDFGFVALMQGETPNDNLTRLTDDKPRIGQIAMEQLDILLRTNQFGLPPCLSLLMIESKWVPGSTLPVRASSRASKKARR